MGNPNRFFKVSAAFMVMVALLAGAAVTSCAFTHPTVTTKFRYKMTVEVQTPEGLKTGSAVREVTYIKDIVTGNYYPSVKGEAVVVDLGKRGVLFGLLRGCCIMSVDYAHAIPLYAFPPPLFADFIKRLPKLEGQSVVLPQDRYPMFVHFKNLGNSKSVQKVIEMQPDNSKWPPKYTVIADHTEEIFGKGVKIKSVSIAITRQPLTHEVLRKLKWLPDVRLLYLDGSQHSRNSPMGLMGGDFVRGE